MPCRLAGSVEDGSADEDSGEGDDGNDDGESENESSGSGTGSDSSDSSADVCPICLSRFKGQEVGNPESCDHNFCLEHILEWAKVCNCILYKRYNIMVNDKCLTMLFPFNL